MSERQQSQRKKGGEVDVGEALEQALKQDAPLEALLAQITPENIHKETDFGILEGKERWGD